MGSAGVGGQAGDVEVELKTGTRKVDPCLAVGYFTQVGSDCVYAALAITPSPGPVRRGLTMHLGPSHRTSPRTWISPRLPSMWSWRQRESMTLYCRTRTGGMSWALSDSEEKWRYDASAISPAAKR